MNVDGSSKWDQSLWYAFQEKNDGSSDQERSKFISLVDAV